MFSLQIGCCLVGRRGFEPLKSKDSGFTVRPIWPLWKLPNAAHTKSQRRDSNPRPADYKSAALPAELLWLIEQQLTSNTHPGIYFKEKNPKFFGMAKVSENFVQQNFRNNF